MELFVGSTCILICAQVHAHTHARIHACTRVHMYRGHLFLDRALQLISAIKGTAVSMTQVIRFMVVAIKGTALSAIRVKCLTVVGWLMPRQYCASISPKTAVERVEQHSPRRLGCR